MPFAVEVGVTAARLVLPVCQVCHAPLTPAGAAVKVMLPPPLVTVRPPAPVKVAMDGAEEPLPIKSWPLAVNAEVTASLSPVPPPRITPLPVKDVCPVPPATTDKVVVAVGALEPLPYTSQ